MLDELKRRPERRERRRVLWLWVLVVGGFVAVSAADSWIAHQYRVAPLWDRNDFLMMWRMSGYLPFWLLIAAAMVLIDSGNAALRHGRRVWFRGLMLFATVTMAGIAAELIKLLIRRERPRENLDPGYFFRSFLEEPLNSSPLGMPSSHATIAFAGAFILSRLYPRATVVWFLFPLGCGYGRLLGGAHFLSDIYGAAFVGCGIAWLMWRHFGPVPNSRANMAISTADTSESSEQAA